MDRVAALATLDRRMLEAFSRRTIARLRAALPLRIVLPRLEMFLEQNLEKELRKDRLGIERAAAALAAGAPPDADAAREVLAGMKRIDREFLHQVRRFPVRIDVPYARIDPLRLQRIEVGLGLAFRVMQAWGDGGKLRCALPRRELERRLHALLDLYARETEALSHSVHLPRLLVPLRERLASDLLQAMAEAASTVARDVVAAVHRQRRGASKHSR